MFWGLADRVFQILCCSYIQLTKTIISGPLPTQYHQLWESQRSDPTTRPWESMTSLMFPAPTGTIASTGAVVPPIAVPQIPTNILTAQPKMQHVAGVDNSVGLLPEPEPTTPQTGTAAVRFTPIIMEQRFDGKVIVKMPVPEYPGTDWYADGYVTGKKGLWTNYIK